MAENLLRQGLELTVYGMGTVFVFLVMLIFATRGMSYLVLRFGGGDTTQLPIVAKSIISTKNLESTQLIAVIIAAVRQYRVSHKK